MPGTRTGRTANAISGCHFAGLTTSTRRSTGSHGDATGGTHVYTWNGRSHPLGAHSGVSQHRQHCAPGPVGSKRPPGDSHANNRQSENHNSGYPDHFGVCHLEPTMRNRIRPNQPVLQIQGWHGRSDLPTGEGATSEVGGPSRGSIELIEVGGGPGQGSIELIQVGGRSGYPE